MSRPAAQTELTLDPRAGLVSLPPREGRAPRRSPLIPSAALVPLAAAIGGALGALIGAALGHILG